jgi:hypothetical protein
MKQDSRMSEINQAGSISASIRARDLDRDLGLWRGLCIALAGSKGVLALG